MSTFSSRVSALGACRDRRKVHGGHVAGCCGRSSPTPRTRLPTLWFARNLVASVGAVSEFTIRRYIETQKVDDASILQVSKAQGIALTSSVIGIPD